MAITAATSGKNRIFRSDAAKCVIESAKPFLSSSVSWVQGDILCLDTTAHTIRAVAATGDAATVLGIADNTIVSGQAPSPYQGTKVDAAQAISDVVGPKYGVVAKMILKTGDAFNPGDKIYLADGGTSQTVSVTDPGDHNHIGIFVDAAVASAAAGQEGQCKLGARAGMSGLAF